MIEIVRTTLRHESNVTGPVEIETSGEFNEFICLTMNRGEHEEGIVFLSELEASDLRAWIDDWIAGRGGPGRHEYTPPRGGAPRPTRGGDA